MQENFDWLKFGVTGVLGFLAGVASEPLKQILKESILKRRIRSAVKHSAIALYWELSWLVKEEDGSLIVPPYEEVRHYMERETTTFWAVRGAASVKILLDRRDKLVQGDRRSAAELLVLLSILASQRIPQTFGGWLKTRMRKESKGMGKFVASLLKPDTTA